MDNQTGEDLLVRQRYAAEVLELRADLGDTLIIPAGMLHFVLTVEDSSLVCVEMAVFIVAEPRIVNKENQEYGKNLICFLLGS